VEMAAAEDQLSLRGVCYGNGLFVAVGTLSCSCEGRYPAILTSPDVYTWTPPNVMPALHSSLNSIAYGNGLFVAVGGYRSIVPLVMPSTDLITWATQEAGAPFAYQRA